MDMKAYADLADTMKLLGDKTRLMILAMLKENEMCVCDIVSALETTQPNVSQHLRKLKSGQFVNETRRGQWIYYSINSDNKPYVLDLLDQVPSMKQKLKSIQLDNCSSQ
jgi:ArsR family transcriptional regulator